MISATTRLAVRRVGLAKAQVRGMSSGGPNTINQQQAAFQKGSTPYLRGDADPTYLRKAGDKPLIGGMLGMAALGWVMVLTGLARLSLDMK